MNVGYSVEQSQIVIPIAWDSQTLYLLAGLEVTLSLAGRDEDGSRWVVRLKGMAELSVSATESIGLGACRRSQPTRGAKQGQVEKLLIPVYRLHGYRETSLGAEGDLVPPRPDQRSRTPC